MDNLCIEECNNKIGLSFYSYIPLYIMFFLIGTETFLISPLLPTISKNLNTTSSMAAYTVTSYVLVYAFAAPFLGNISDKYGRIKFIVIGSSIFFVGNILCSLAPTINLLICARAVTGLGGAMVGPSMWSYIGDTSDSSIRGRIISLGGAFFALGQVLGIPIASFLASWKGWRWAFCSIGIGVALTVIVLIINFKLTHAVEQINNDKHQIGFFIALKNKEIALALAITFFCQSANLGAYTYLGEILNKNYNLSLKELGLISTIVGFASIIGALISGRLSDKWRNAKKQESSLVSVWAIILGSSILLLTITHNMLGSMIFIAFWFLANGAFTSAQQTLLTLIAPNMRATSVSWNNSIMYVGNAVGIFIMGYAWENGISIGVIAFVLAIISTCFSFMLTKLRRRNQL